MCVKVKDAVLAVVSLRCTPVLVVRFFLPLSLSVGCMFATEMAYCILIRLMQKEKAGKLTVHC